MRTTLTNNRGKRRTEILSHFREISVYVGVRFVARRPHPVYRQETFRIEWRWYCDDANRFSRWRLPAMRRVARFASFATTYCWSALTASYVLVADVSLSVRRLSISL